MCKFSWKNINVEFWPKIPDNILTYIRKKIFIVKLFFNFLVLFWNIFIISPEQGSAQAKKSRLPVTLGYTKTSPRSFPASAWKKAVKIVKVVSGTVGPHKFWIVKSKIVSNKTPLTKIWTQAPCFDKIRDLYCAFRIFNIKSVLISIEIGANIN